MSFKQLKCILYFIKFNQPLNYLHFIYESRVEQLHESCSDLYSIFFYKSGLENFQITYFINNSQDKNKKISGFSDIKRGFKLFINRNELNTFIICKFRYYHVSMSNVQRSTIQYTLVLTSFFFPDKSKYTHNEYLYVCEALKKIHYTCSLYQNSYNTLSQIAIH